MVTNIAFSGRIGSGKTAVSREIAKTLGFRWNSFGAIVKKIAAERSLPISRENLQSIGEEYVSKDPEYLCRRVIAEAETASSQCIVIDGLRHIEIQTCLKKLLYPQELLCIHVEVQNCVRDERLMLRDGLRQCDIDQFETHSTEVQVLNELKDHADQLIDNSESIDLTVEHFIAWLNNRMRI